MSSIRVIQGDFEKKLKLQFAPGIKAGFPSPAEDYSHETLDFNRDLIRNPEATFYGKVEGDSMIEAGILDGDTAIIRQQDQAHNGQIVVALVNNSEATLKKLKKDGDFINLIPCNKDYSVQCYDAKNVKIQGILSGIIRKY